MARFIVAAAWMAALITHAERVDVRDVVAEEGDALRVLVVTQSRGKLSAGGVRRALGAFGVRWRDQLETPIDVVVVSPGTSTYLRIRSQNVVVFPSQGRNSEVASEQRCRGICTGRCIHSPGSRCSPFGADAPLPLGCRRGTFLAEQYLRVLESSTSRRRYGLQWRVVCAPWRWWSERHCAVPVPQRSAGRPREPGRLCWCAAAGGSGRRGLRGRGGRGGGQRSDTVTYNGLSPAGRRRCSQ